MYAKVVKKRLREGQLVSDKLGIFWMTYTITEFGFRKMKRFMQISEGVILSSADNILLNLHNSSHPTQPHSVIAKYSLYTCISEPI